MLIINKNKRLIVALAFICLLLTSCQKETPATHNPQNESSETSPLIVQTMEDEILVTVFEIPVYKAEYEKACIMYPDFEPKEILEGLVMEAVVLHKADELGYTVTDTEIADKISELKEANPSFYKLAIKQYETEEKYRTALSNRLLYTKVFDTVSEEFESKYKYKADVMEEETSQYISENNIDSAMQDEIKGSFISNYTEAAKRVYFKKWNYEATTQSEIDYFAYNEKKLFSKPADDNALDTAVDKGVPNFASLDLDTAQKVYSAYLNLQSHYLEQNYEIESIKSTPATQTKFQKLFVAYTSKYYSRQRMTISLVLAPFKSQNTLPNTEQEGMDKITINGFDGYISRNHSEKTDREKSLISLRIYLSEINGIVTFSSENCTEDELLLIINSCFKLEKIE